MTNETRTPSPDVPCCDQMYGDLWNGNTHIVAWCKIHGNHPDYDSNRISPFNPGPDHRGIVEPIEPQPDDYSGAEVFDPADSTRIDARGLAEADLDSQVRAHIEAQSATIAGLNAEVERWHGSYTIAHDQATENGRAAVKAEAAVERMREAVALIVGKDDGRGLYFSGPVLGVEPRILPFHMLKELRAALAPKEG